MKKSLKLIICLVLALVIACSTAYIAFGACVHEYEFTSTPATTCKTKAYSVYTCKKCNATKKVYEVIGHRYKVDSYGYRKVNYKCSVCGEACTIPLTTLNSKFKSCINRYKFDKATGLTTNVMGAGVETTSTNQSITYAKYNVFFDFVSDGVINAKDYAILKEMKKPQLTNMNADANAKKLYSYIASLDASSTLSGQQESTWMGSVDYEINHIYNNTGKKPAIRGFDYMNDDFSGVNKRAKAWAKQGGIVTICWHTGSDFSGEWNEAMNTTVSNWTNMLTEGTDEYNQMIAGMDKAARSLQDLQNAGVTVLWRPFHEFDGQWFWWGKGGATKFKKMWQIMYDRYTNYWHLNNLIWVLGYSDKDCDKASWNPGEEYYDIIGFDTYDLTKLSSMNTKVKANSNAPSYKPYCLHECGKNPTATQLKSYGFSYFMTWHTTYLTDNNTATTLKNLYNSDQVITLDEIDY